MKKFIGIALGCCIALGSFGVSATKSGFDDKVSELVSYGIMSESTVSMAETDTVTRGQMMQYVINALQLCGSEPTSPTTAFVDVNNEHPNANAIYLAYELGIVHGTGDGNFCPDDAVTYEQSAKILVNMLGYYPFALQKGGYPSGYVAAASTIGVTADMNFVPSDKITLYDAVVMLSNAVKTPLMEQTGYGSEAVYEVMNGKNGKPLVTLEQQYETDK